MDMHEDVSKESEVEPSEDGFLPAS
jgi:hypothetical protein